MKSKLYKRCFFLIASFPFIFHISGLAAQDQKLADSLERLYETGRYSGSTHAILQRITFNEQNPDRRLLYAQRLIDEVAKDSLFDFLHTGYLEKGNALRDKGQYAAALESYIESIRYARQNGDSLGVGKLAISIADTYSEIGNVNNARLYYVKGINTLRKTADSVSLATALLNAGDDAFKNAEYETAISYFNESGRLFRNASHLVGSAYNLGNLGMVYAQLGQDAQAETNINGAIDLLEEIEDYYAICIYLTYMADIYMRKDALATSLQYAQKSLELAKEYRLNGQISEANLKLSELYEHKGDTITAYAYYKAHIAYRDSVKNIEVIQQMADQRTNFEVSQKQIEVDLLDQKRKNQRVVVIATVIALCFIGLLAMLLYRRNLFIRKTKRIIEEERNRSDNLLRNILPEETAEELKTKGRVKAKKYEAVTVLFTDFQHFTSHAERLSPEVLVELVGHYFSKFDDIMEKYGLEKIKTIGDSYMCAAGLPFANDDHAKNMMMAAIDIINFVQDTKLHNPDAPVTFDIRIGINTGPVVAGVVGTRKFAYDIWGDTVNIASRMESMSEPGKINISETTYQLVKHIWPCTYRGEIQVKNRGALKMYYVNL